MFCHISSGWFKHIEPHRTPSKRMILERGRCVVFCHISSGWFKHIEPHRTPSKLIILERGRCVEFVLFNLEMSQNESECVNSVLHDEKMTDTGGGE